MFPVYNLSKINGFAELLGLRMCAPSEETGECKPNKHIVATQSKYIKKNGENEEALVANYTMFHYDKSILSNCLVEEYGLLRSVIANENKQLVSFSPPKSLQADDFIKMFPLREEAIIAEEMIEGTMINVFWDAQLNMFNIATKSTIGGNVYFFKNKEKKTFKMMFEEVASIAKLDIQTLNKHFCYSFVMQHPDNRIVVPFAKPQLYLIAVYSIVQKWVNEAVFLDVYQCNPHDAYDWSSTGVQFPKRYEQWNNYTELINKYASLNTPYTTLGVMIKNMQTGARCKVRNPVYEEVRQLRGNQPKHQYQYLSLRQQGKVRDFLKYFPEYKKDFSQFREQVHAFTNTLYLNYISHFIKKEAPIETFPEQFRTHMFKLHEKYKTELKPNNSYVSNTVVIEYVNTLHTSQLMHVLNYNFKVHNNDCKKNRVQDPSATSPTKDNNDANDNNGVNDVNNTSDNNDANNTNDANDASNAKDTIA